jgi:hypothetical protein
MLESYKVNHLPSYLTIPLTDRISQARDVSVFLARLNLHPSVETSLTRAGIIPRIIPYDLIFDSLEEADYALGLGAIATQTQQTDSFISDLGLGASASASGSGTGSNGDNSHSNSTRTLPGVNGDGGGGARERMQALMRGDSFYGSVRSMRSVDSSPETVRQGSDQPSRLME